MTTVRCMSNSGLCMCRLEKKLPSWCHLRMLDSSRPLHEQVFCVSKLSNLGHAVMDGAWLTLGCSAAYVERSERMHRFSRNSLRPAQRAGCKC